MAGKTTLTVEVNADVSGAVAGMDKASGAVRSYGDAASGAATKSRDISGAIEGTGDSAANVTTGLRDLGGAMQTMGGTVGAMGTAMVGASTAFEAMDGAATLYKGAQQAATMAAGGFSKAMQFMKVTILTNPIFIIAAIIIGIAVALVVAYKKSETFRNIVNGAFNAVKSVIMTVYNWIKNNWPLLLAILTGPIGLAVLAITRNWDTIRNGISGLVSWIRSAWTNTVDTLITQPFTLAWSVISGVFDKITGAIESVIGWVSRIKFPSPPSWLSAVIPGSFAAAPPVAGVARGAPAAAPRASAGGPSIVVNGALDPEAVARQIRRILAGSDTRGGRVGALRSTGVV